MLQDSKAIDLRSALSQARLRLDRDSRTPFYRQLYERFSEGIQTGILEPGQRLPSARSLAQQLATSRGTVDIAYSILAAEGYTISRGPAGTVVAQGIPLRSKSKRKNVCTEQSSKVLPFQMGLPALDAFPRKLWARLTVRRARSLSDSDMIVPDPAGYAPLREAIVSYLAVSRGIVCTPSQVFITPGFQAALGLVTRAFLQLGDSVWMEDPGYFLARRGFLAAGARVTPVPVDREGLNVETGRSLDPGARVAYVTPSHQAPIGVALTPARRLALLAWATANRSWILEDDYDSEFRYGSRPLPALKGLDDAGRVLYVGSFSKVLFPGLRLAYLVVPEPEVQAVGRICQFLHRGNLLLPQQVVTDFMTEGRFPRHIGRMRSLYADRREVLAAALIKEFGTKIDVSLDAGGMHLLARFDGKGTDIDWAMSASAAGLAPAPLSPWCIDVNEQGLLISFTNASREACPGLAHLLKQALKRYL